MKIQLTIILLFFCFTSFAQSGSDLFWKIRKKRLSNDSIWWSSAKKALENNDSLMHKTFFYPDSLVRENEKLVAKLIGCQFPDATQLLDNETAMSTIYNDFTILNFHNRDGDTIQLEDLAKLKKESCESITIIAFFPDSKEEIQSIINKYKKEIFFVTDAENYILEHSLNLGGAVIWVLNKEKVIKYIHSGYYKEKGKLYFELKNKMNFFSDSYR